MVCRLDQNCPEGLAFTVEPHSDLVDGGIPCVLSPWPLGRYCSEIERSLSVKRCNAMGNVLSKHALLQRLVLVSASPSNREGSPFGTLCKFWGASEKEVRFGGKVPLTTGSHSFKARAFVVLRRVSSSLRERAFMRNDCAGTNVVWIQTRLLSCILVITSSCNLTPRRSFRWAQRWRLGLLNLSFAVLPPGLKFDTWQHPRLSLLPKRNPVSVTCWTMVLLWTTSYRANLYRKWYWETRRGKHLMNRVDSL